MFENNKIKFNYCVWAMNELCKIQAYIHSI